MTQEARKSMEDEILIDEVLEWAKYQGIQSQDISNTISINQAHSKLYEAVKHYKKTLKEIYD